MPRAPASRPPARAPPLSAPVPPVLAPGRPAPPPVRVVGHPPLQILGGLFIGAWLALLAFAPFDAAVRFGVGWWGLVGLLLGGVAYVARVAPPGSRVLVWVVVGILVGGLLTAASIHQAPTAWALVPTWLGGGLIASQWPVRAAATDAGGGSPT